MTKKERIREYMKRYAQAPANRERRRQQDRIRWAAQHPATKKRIVKRAVDLLGQTFGRLTVTAAAPSRHEHAMWVCSCACGVESTVDGTSLRRGNTQSCGCLRRELARGRLTTHGMSISREWRSYSAAKSRCTYPKSVGWKYYGGRGIQFKFKSFEQFYAELGPRPKGMSLDRINNNGPYAPGNVRWATAKQQRLNQRPTITRRVGA